MAQEIYHNFLAPLRRETDALKLAGILKPGRYQGFNALQKVNNNGAFRVLHVTPGVESFTSGNVASSRACPGIWVHPSGIVVKEDAAIDITLTANTTNNERLDLLVVNYQYTEGSNTTATYQVLNGTTNLTFNPTSSLGARTVLMPAPTTENDLRFRVPLGFIRVPPNQTLEGLNPTFHPLPRPFDKGVDAIHSSARSIRAGSTEVNRSLGFASIPIGPWDVVNTANVQVVAPSYLSIHAPSLQPVAITSVDVLIYTNQSNVEPFALSPFTVSGSNLFGTRGYWDVALEGSTGLNRNYRFLLSRATMGWNTSSHGGNGPNIPGLGVTRGVINISYIVPQTEAPMSEERLVSEFVRRWNGLGGDYNNYF